MPQEIDEVERRITQLEIERQALQKEKDKASRDRLKALERDLAELREKSAGMKAQWQQEKETLGAVGKIKQQIEQARIEAERATRAGDLQKAAEITYGQIPQLERQMGEAEQKLGSKQGGGARVLKEEVTAEDVAEIVSRWTGIPVAKMLEGERERLTKLESELSRRVIGQEEAVEAVSNAVRRSRAGLQDPNRPIGSFIFLGPTGVGKTETARALAEVLFEHTGEDQAVVEAQVTNALRQHFRPEFLNRVDDIIIFRPLGKGQIQHIIDLQLKRLESLLADRKLTLELTPSAREVLATEGYDPAFGARPLKRAIQRLLQNPLALAVLEGKFSEGDHIVVDRDAKGELTFRKAAEPALASK